MIYCFVNIIQEWKMRRLQQKRSIAKFLCVLLILEMFVASPNVAEARTEGINRGTSKTITVASNEKPFTVTLYDPTKPENTKVVDSSVPSWIKVTKTSYYSASFTVSINDNAGGGERSATIQFTDGTYKWYAYITQKKPTPTNTPTQKKSSNNGSKNNNTTSKGSTPTPKATPVPTSTPTPIPALTTSATALNFRADGETKAVLISGYTGPLRADRGNNDTWFTLSVSGGTVSVTATKNTSTARTSYFDVTDTGSGRSVRIQVNQAAPIYNTEPTKAPTNTPTPTPAETLPVKTKKLQFSSKGGQDTITLDGKGYNLAFSYPENPSVPSGWVDMSYENSKIVVKVKQNKDRAPRSMKVTITDKNTNQYAYVTINQSAAPTPTPRPTSTPTPTPYLKISEGDDSVTVSYKGAREVVTLDGVEGNCLSEYTWEPKTVTNWVHDVPFQNQVTFVVDTNLDINPREAKVKITDEKTKKTVTYTITQEGMPNTAVVSNTIMRVDKEIIQLGFKEEVATITVSGKKGSLQVNREEDANWISVEVNGNTIQVKAGANNGQDREGHLNITDTGNGQRIRVTVKQSGMPIVKKGETKTYYIIAQGDTMYASIDAKGHPTITRENGENVSWVTVMEETGRYKFKIDANKTGNTRKAVILFATDPNGGQGITTTIINIIQSGAVVLYRNYMGASENIPCMYPKEGENYGALPKLKDRDGFEFDGWYTEAYGGEKVGEFSKYDGVHNNLYAHWKVTVSFPDTYGLNVKTNETTAQEGCLVGIPSPIIKELGYYGFDVVGWTRNPEGHKVDNGAASFYRLPKDLQASKVNLWAINSKGETFYEYYQRSFESSTDAMAECVKNKTKRWVKSLEETYENWKDIENVKEDVAAVDKVASGVDDWKDNEKVVGGLIGGMELFPGTPNVLGPWTDETSEKNKEANEALEKDLKENYGELEGYINGQRRAEINSFRIGEMSLGQAGCGIIACYNGLYGCGVKVSLSDLISYAEQKRYLWGSYKEVVEWGIKSTPEDNIIHKALESIKKRGSDNLTGFGVNPQNIGDILRAYGVSSKKFTNRNSFLSSLNDAVQRGEKKRYIFDYWVCQTIDGLYQPYSQHYVYIETSGNAGEKTIMIYNSNSYEKYGKSVTYQNIVNMLIGEKGENIFIVAYEVKG